MILSKASRLIHRVRRQEHSRLGINFKQLALSSHERDYGKIAAAPARFPKKPRIDSDHRLRQLDRRAILDFDVLAVPMISHVPTFPVNDFLLFESVLFTRST